MDIMKESFDVLPTWIQMRVDFKYWNRNYLRKLVELVGKFVKVDQATEKKEKLQFSRVMIEVTVD